MKILQQRGLPEYQDFTIILSWESITENGTEYEISLEL